jgi:uncharacterized protein DUF6152
MMTDGGRPASIGAEPKNGRERIMRLYRAGVVAVALSFAAAAGQAHHSMAMFDAQKKVTLNGTVREFQWTNPHAYIQLLVKDGTGATKEWSLEMGAPMYLYANGWRPSTLKAGQQISVTINPLRSGNAGGVVIDATTADGKTLGNKR